MIAGSLMTHRPVLRRLLAACGLLAGGLVLAAVALALSLQSEGGRHWVADRLAALASSPGTTVAIGALDGRLPFAVTLVDVTVADHKGRWLTAHRTDLRIDGGALFRGRLDVVELAVDRLDITRPPLPLPEPAAIPVPLADGTGSAGAPRHPDTATPSAADKTPPMVPTLPLPITVRRVVVEELALGAALLGGEAALLHAEGDARLGDHRQPQRLDLDLSRRDGQPGSGHLHVNYAPDTDRLDLDLAAAEPPGGVLARALRLHDLPALEFKATGSAPLANWHGTLTANAGQRAALAADATIHRTTGGYLIALQGGGDITALMPARWATLIGPVPRLALDLLADDDGGLALRPASSLTIAAANLTAQGKLDPDTNRLTLDYRLTPTAEVLVAAGVLPPGSHWRQAVVSGTLEGPPAAPTITAAARVEEPAATNLAAHTLTATLRSTPAVASAQTIASGERAVTLDAAVEYLIGADSTVTRLAGPHAQLAVNATTHSYSGEIALSNIVVTVAAGRMTATATANPTAGRVKATGRFTVNQLSRLLGPFGLPLSGVADLNLSLQANRQSLQLEVSGTTGTLRTEIDTIDPVLMAVLDDTLRVKGTVAMDSQGIHARDWHLDGHQFAFSGQADLTSQRLEATARVDLPHLDPLADPLGLPHLTGSSRLDASWHGPLTAGIAKATLVLSDLGVSGRALGRTELDLSGSGLPSAGRLQVALRAAGGIANLVPLTASATVALSPDGKALVIDPVALRQGDNRAGGTFRLALDGTVTNGHVTGQWPDLATLAPLTGMPLSGRGRIDALLTRHSDQTVLQFAGGTNALRLGGKPAAPAFSATDIEFKGSVAAATFGDLTGGHLTGSVAVTGQAVKAGTTGLANLTATLDGSPSHATLRFTAPPSPGQPTSFDLAGTLGTTPEGLRLRLTQLGGLFGNLPVTLAHPATFDLSQNHLAVAGLRLSGLGYYVDANGAIGADGLSGRLEVVRLPLALLHLFFPAVPGRGRLDAEATLSGSLADPRADISAQVKEAEFAETEAAGLDLGVLNGRVQAHWRGDRLVADGEVLTGSGANLHGHGETPLTLRLDPLTVKIPETAALHATVAGGIELATFSDLLADRGDHLAGRLTVDVTVGGTLAAPDLGGQVTVSDGRYENQLLGSVIDHISARLTGSGTTFTLEQLTGHTVEGGQIAATGAFRLAAAAGEAFDLHLTAEDARLVQVDPITANVDADLTLTGGLKAARLAGTLAVRRADIRLPDRLPSEVINLQVIEAHPKPTPGPAPAAAPPPAAKSSRKPVLPGSTVRVTAPPPTTAAQPVTPAPPGPPSLTLALAITAHNNVFVHGRGVDSEFSADLKVSGAMPTPAIKGTLTMLHGRLDLLGKEFQFKHGTIDFAGGSDLDPDLDLLAEARTSNVTAEAVVSGRAWAPQLTLTSVPVMPQDEIMARLLFDKPVSQLGALEAVQLADSAAQLTGLGGSASLVERLRRTLGIDRLGVTSSTPGAKRETLEAGRYVAKDIYLGVQQGPAEDSSRAKVEVAITKTLQAEVDVGVRADPQVGLKFEWDY